MTHDTVVVGGGVVGETLARALDRNAVEVVYLDDDARAVERAVESGVDAQPVERSEASTLDRVKADDVSVAIVASREDGRNLLVAQLLQVRRARHVVALVNDPENVDLFVDAGVEPVCVTSVLASALDERRQAVRTTEPTSAATADETDECEDVSNGEVNA